MAKGNFETHDFYCMNCGRKALPLMRNRGHRHASLHKKALYCPYCRVVVNHIEIATEDQKNWFLEGFANGNFQREALESMQYCNEVKR